jgi:flavin reductase ActVB
VTAATMTQAGTFRDAMASFPSGVTIVTTSDEAGRWRGFTATSFSSVSMDPPLVLTCLATSAECYPAFEAAQSWVVHFIETDQTDLAMRFATRGADKFAGADFTADENGLPILGNAHVTLRCSSYAKYPGGDHLILVGRVEEAEIDDAGLPAIYFRRSFHVPPLRIEGTQV